MQLIPSERALEHRAAETAPGTELRLRTALTGVATDYQLVLIDCPPNLGELTRNALYAADAALVVTEPSFFAVQSAAQAVDAIEVARAAGIAGCACSASSPPGCVRDSRSTGTGSRNCTRRSAMWCWSRFRIARRSSRRRAHVCRCSGGAAPRGGPQPQLSTTFWTSPWHQPRTGGSARESAESRSPPGTSPCPRRRDPPGRTGGGPGRRPGGTAGRADAVGWVRTVLRTFARWWASVARPRTSCGRPQSRAGAGGQEVGIQGGKKKSKLSKKERKRRHRRVKLQVEVPPDVRSKLRKNAKARGTSVDDMVTAVLQGWLDA